MAAVTVERLYTRPALEVTCERKTPPRLGQQWGRLFSDEHKTNVFPGMTQTALSILKRSLTLIPIHFQLGAGPTFSKATHQNERHVQRTSDSDVSVAHSEQR